MTTIALPTDVREPNVDDDALAFYLRITADISTLTTAPNRLGNRLRASHRLWEALSAPDAARSDSWCGFYVQVRTLVAFCAADLQAGRLHDACIPALDRLRQFLRENSDIDDATDVQDFGRSAVAGAARA